MVHFKSMGSYSVSLIRFFLNKIFSKDYKMYPFSLKVNYVHRCCYYYYYYYYYYCNEQFIQFVRFCTINRKYFFFFKCAWTHTSISLISSNNKQSICTTPRNNIVM